MSFLSPLAALLAAAVAIPALVILYYLKLRRRRATVPSTLLWKRAVQDLQVNSPFQKIKNNLLLWLQLLLLLALLVALARPVTRDTAVAGQKVVIVIDHSASMGATLGDGTRLEDAQRRALAILESLEGSPTMVVTFAERAQVLTDFTADRTRLRTAINRIQATDQRSRLAEALALIEPEAQQAQAAGGEPLRVYVLTDGRIHADGEDPLALPGADIVYEPTLDETQATNAAVTAFAARRDYQQPQRVRVYARVSHFGPEPLETTATLHLDGRVLRSQPIKLRAADPAALDDQGLPAYPDAPEQEMQFEFDQVGSGVLRLSLNTDDIEDALPSDNHARLILAPATPVRALLVSEGNQDLVNTLDAMPIDEFDVVTPDAYEAMSSEDLRRPGWEASDGEATPGYDLIVFDRHAPTTVPVVDAVYFGSVPPIEGLRRVPTEDDDERVYSVIRQQPGHALLRNVVLDDVRLRQPGRLVLPSGTTILATSEPGPIIAELTQQSVRHVVVSMPILGLTHGDFPYTVPYLAFFQNTVETLGLGQLAEGAGLSYRTGESAVLPLDLDEVLTYESADTELEARPTQGRAALPAWSRVGLYTAERRIPAPYDRLAVNLLDETESDLRGVNVLPVGVAPVAASNAGATWVTRELWPWLVAAALAFLLIEWWVYTRRVRL